MYVARSIKEIDSLATGMLALEDEAYNEFARIFGPRLRALFIRQGLTMADAEDLAVSCVTDIALKVEKYKQISEGGFGAWVFTLARHALADWRRSHHPTEELPDDLAAQLIPADDEEQNLDAILAVREALAQFSEMDQSLILLRNLGDEYSYAELSERLGISREAARVRHFRALKRLKVILEKDPRIKSLLELDTDLIETHE
jgi:RNA polymerase sigma factor (sigma-70 family)